MFLKRLLNLIIVKGKWIWRRFSKEKSGPKCFDSICQTAEMQKKTFRFRCAEKEEGEAVEVEGDERGHLLRSS